MAARSTHRDDGQRRRWVAVGILVVITVVAYALVLHSFNASARSHTGITVSTPTLAGMAHADRAPGFDGFHANGKIFAADIAEESRISLRLVFDQAFSEDRSARGELVGGLQLVVRSDTGNQSIPFGAAGQPTPVVDVNINLRGRIADYPFDSYDSTFLIYVQNPQQNETVGQVPTSIDLTGGLHGLAIDFHRATGPFGEYGVRAHLHRGAATLFWAFFVMVFMWALALVGVAMAVMLLVLRREIGPGPLAFLVALLFAFPAIRNALPGTPALGAKFDYLVFFWAEGIVAVTTVFLAVAWILREVRSSADRA